MDIETAVGFFVSALGLKARRLRSRMSPSRTDERGYS